MTRMRVICPILAHALGTDQAPDWQMYTMLRRSAVRLRPRHCHRLKLIQSGSWHHSTDALGPHADVLIASEVFEILV